jgi:hypothetical protein
MSRTPFAETTASIEDRIRHVGVQIREGFLPIVQEVAGHTARPSWLVRRFHLDKSLASRLSRAFRTDDPFEFMHLVPAPTGLRIVLAAARRAKIDSEVCHQAEAGIGLFQALIDETPGGRATLDAAISASSQEARDRNERSAKQAVYKAMSYLLGLRCENIITSFIMQPSADGRMADAIDIHHRIGMRRIRPSAPMGLFSLRFHPPVDDSAPHPSIETLDGEPATEAYSSILREFSSDPLPDLEVFEEEDTTVVALSGDEPPLDSPFTISSALVVRNAMEMYRSPNCKDEGRGYLLNYPCKMVVRDVFIRDDLYVGSVPEITLRVPSPKGAVITRRPGLHGKVDTVDLPTPIENLGLGLANIAVKEVPSYTALLHHAFERSGWDPARFRGYRTRIIYPIPMVLMSWWFSLPEPPG